MTVSNAKSLGSDRGAHRGLVYFINFSDCLRGIDVNSGSEPPNNAKCLALSRSTRASKPSRTNAVSSWTPVSSTACAYKSSSIFSVVLMFGFLVHQIERHYMASPVLNKFSAMYEKSNNAWKWIEMEVRWRG